nr:MAG TPA: minor capsid protein [Caudoviricetes sp.]
MSSREYWKNRETEAKNRNVLEEAEYNRRIQEIYETMLDEITKEINGFYARYAKKEGITMAEARRRAEKLDIEAYARKAKKYVAEKDFSDVANEEMRIYNLTMKVNRLELLKANIGLEMAAGFDDLQKYFDKKLTKRTLDEFRRQAGILGKSVMQNEKYAHAIVNASFKSATYSDRIWMYQGMLKSEIEGLLISGLIRGQNPRKLARHLTKRFGVSASNAERLMSTELSRVRTEAQKQSFMRNGFDEYEFVACTNKDVCSLCRGLDGEHFKVEDMMPGENAPPMHPSCHCSVAAHMDDEIYEKWLSSYQQRGLSYEEYSRRARKTELRLDDSTDKWAKEAKRELHKSEQSIGKRTKETMEIYDATGKFIMSKRGGESSVRISLKDYTKLKNAVVTHNHPSGGSFSFTDLKFLKRMPISELRVAVSDGAYYIRKPDKWPEELKDIQYMEKIYKQIEKSLKSKYQRMYNEGRITKSERYQMYRNDVNKTFSERYGLEYGYETYE